MEFLIAMLISSVIFIGIDKIVKTEQKREKIITWLCCYLSTLLIAFIIL